MVIAPHTDLHTIVGDCAYRNIIGANRSEDLVFLNPLVISAPNTCCNADMESSDITEEPKKSCVEVRGRE